MENRKILHIDMDAFYTSVEENQKPELKDKPIVVGADPKQGKGRGVVSTCNYKAREYGIHSGMPISQAYRKCPKAKYLPVRMKLYKKVSKRVTKIIKKYGEKFEQTSIDESYIELEKNKNFSQAETIAKEIKEEIKEKENLTCSVGIGKNKLIAKIASDKEKPDGLTIVKPEETQKFLDPLPVRELHGVGEKTEQKLHEINIQKVKELRKTSLEKLQKIFGESKGKYLYQTSRGRDKSKVKPKEKIKSISKRTTFEKDTKNKEKIYQTLKKLSKKTYKNFINKKLKSFQKVTLIIRYEDFETHTKQHQLIEPSQNKEVIYKTAKRLLRKFMPLPQKVRLIGIKISELKK